MRVLRVSAVFAFFVQAAPCRAQDHALPLELTWDAPAECASAQQVRAELARIARPRAGRSLPHVVAEGRVIKHAARYTLTLRTERNGQTGQRTLEAPECRSLEREVTLLLALAFGEGVEMISTHARAEANAAPDVRGVVGQHAASDALEVPVVPPERAANAESSAQRTSSETRIEAESRTTTLPSPADVSSHEPFVARAALALGGGVIFALLPSAAGMLVLGGELGGQSFWLEPSIVWLPGVEATLPRRVHARFDAAGAALSGCLALDRLAAGLSVCLGATASALRGRSAGTTDDGEAVAPLFAAALGVGFRWPPRTAFGLRLEARLQMALNQPRFLVDGLGEVHRVPRFGPSIAATFVFGTSR